MRSGMGSVWRATVIAVAALLAQTALAFKGETDGVSVKQAQAEKAVVAPAQKAVPQGRLLAAAARPDLTVRWDGKKGMPAMVRGADLLAEGDKAAGKQVAVADEKALGVRAIAVMGNLKGLYGIQDAPQEFRPESTVVATQGGYRHVRLNQVYKGLPVFGSQVIVHFDGQGKARAVNGAYQPIGDLATTPVVTADQSLATAKGDQKAMNNPAGVVKAGPELVVFARNTDPKIAWHMTIGYDDGRGLVGRWQYWVDAKTGVILLKYNDIQHASVSRPYAQLGTNATITGAVLGGEGGGTVSVQGWVHTNLYYLTSFTNRWQIFNAGGGVYFVYPDGGTYASRFGTPNWSTSDRAEMSAARAMEAIQSYYKTVHGRNSYDNKGTMAPAYVHYGNYYANAFWDGTSLYLGDGDGRADPLGVVDIVAHEVQHGVTEYSAGLVYMDESGQLNESFSDIFGSLNEFALQPDGRAAYPASIPGASDWLLGEDSWIVTTALRDMRNPTNTVTVGAGNEQPTRYKGTYWYYGTGDNGGVHLNNSIQNFFFYLLCEGGSGLNDGAIPYVVYPIGIPAAGKLAYGTLTGYMTPLTDYAAAREAWLACAEDFDEAGITTNAAISVGLAWGAVGIGELSLVAPGEPFVSGGEPASSVYFPSSKVYKVVRDSMSNATTWAISVDQPWLTVSPTSVTVPLSEVCMAVTVSVVTAAADLLPAGVHRGAISFTNDTGTYSNSFMALLHLASNYTVRGETYDWIDPVAKGHSLVNVSGGYTAPYALPFNVLFYGETNNAISISAAGMLGFATDGMGLTNVAMPDWRAPNAIVCPLWAAIDGTDPAARVYLGVEGAASHHTRKVVVTWVNVPSLVNAGARFTFQAILEENGALDQDNDIVFAYKDVAESSTAEGAGRNATVGIEDAYGALFRQYAHMTNWLANGTALRFTHNPGVDTSAPVGTVRVLGHSGDEVSFEVRFNEPVRGLTSAGLSLAGSTVPGVSIAGISGGGFRYVVTVGGVSVLGRVNLSVLAGAVQDLSGNPNLAFGPEIYVVPVMKTSFSDTMEAGVGGWNVTTQVFEYLDTRGWQLGVPTYAGGPVSASSPTKCWGTSLTGACPPFMSSARLTSAPIWVDRSPVLEFDYWGGLGAYGIVEVNAGTGWNDVTPDSEFGPFLLWTFGSWMRQRVQLPNDNFGSRHIQVRFSAYGYTNNVEPGIYVDNVVVTSERDPGFWVVSYSPSNGVPSTTVPVTMTGYNSTTGTLAALSGSVGCAEFGVSITSGVPIAYGTVAAGEFSSGAGPVGLVLGSTGNFARPLIQLSHLARSGVTEVGQQTLPFTVAGVSESAASNTLTVKSTLFGIGVTNWLGQYLPGDGGATSCIYQVIYAGANGTNDPPLPNGQVAGDDRLLYASVGGLPWGEFGGGGVPSGVGQFKKAFSHGLPAGARVYVRAFDGSSFGGAVAYGDSLMYALSNMTAQTKDFGGWLVGLPLDPSRDSNGDTIPDGLAIQRGLDPREPITGLTAGWNLLGQMGKRGDNAGQFAGSTPSPTRLFFKDAFLYVLDTGHNKVQVWNRLTGLYIGSYGSTGSGNGQFQRPYGMALDPRSGTNRFAIADQGNFRVQVFDFNPALGTNIVYAFSFGDSNTLTSIRDVAIAPDGRFYVTDEFAVHVFSAAGVYSTDLATGGTSAGYVMRPWGVTVGSGGQVVVADTENNRIQSWNSSGVWQWSAGTAGSGAGQLTMPRDAAFGPGGYLYVADTGNSRLAIYKPDGTFVANLGSHGFGFEVLMSQPWSLAPVVDSNLVYVADTLNNRVLTVQVIFDSDGDGMDDVWEILHGLDPTNPNDAAQDLNGNGFSNLGEYRLQQDPGAVGVIITAFSFNPQVLRWQTVASGGVYRIEYAHGASGLLSSNWQAGPVVTSQVIGALSVTNGLTLTNTVEFIRVLKIGP